MLERVWRKGNPPTLLVGMQTGISTMENNMEVPLKNWNRAIPLLGIYPEKTIIRKDTRTPMFTAALFTIARTRKQPKCPSTEEWIKMWYTYTTEYCSAIKEQNNGICSNMDGTRDSHTEWNKSEKDKYDIAYMWNLKKGYKWTSTNQK